MDAPIASPVMQPAPPRPAELNRVQPPPATARMSGRLPPRIPPSFAEQAAQRAENRANAERTVERDEATGSLVYRLIDVATGEVAEQTPGEAQLRLRAYIDRLTASSDKPSFETRA